MALSHLLSQLKAQVSCMGDVDDFVYRVSQQADLARVRQHGSSRVGISSKLWDGASRFDVSAAPFHPILHEDVIIASRWTDLEEDVACSNGTLRHKLHIYEQPFFTLYRRSALMELGRESPEAENNQGRHYLFLGDKLSALHSLWQIVEENNQYKVRQIPLK